MTPGTSVFLWCLEQGADILLSVKENLKVQLGEDAHRYANRTGAGVFSFLRTVAMNLLRRGGCSSIRQGLRELAYDIREMLALGGVATPPLRAA